MENFDVLLDEIKSVKYLLSKLIGTADLPAEQRFSIEALDKAAKAFQKLSIERGEWVADEDIDKFIKNAPYRAGAFIREEFEFANYFKRGSTYFYYKQDLIALSKELKERNVHLERYKELKEDQLKFEKYVQSVFDNKGEKHKKPFKIGKDAKDITPSPPQLPPLDIIKSDVKRLKEEFFKYKLEGYIDIYKNNYAMLKNIYYFQKYIEPEVKKRARKWCDDFNLANRLIQEITKKKVEVFVPVRDDDMIQL